MVPKPDNLFEIDRNCWRIAQASRAAALVDGDAYFQAFRSAVLRARRSILIVGWDIDSRIALTHDDNANDWPNTLGEFLDAVVRARRGLRAHVLVWDFAMIYAGEREWMPLYKLHWRTHSRVHFALDDQHPFGASHHQKIVVIDDTLAFVGGLDLTRCRWDTPEHRADDPRRINVNGERYAPFHDVQLMVEGAVARELGDLVRERWQRATGRSIRRPGPSAKGLWLEHVVPDFEQVPVAIARTEPEHGGRRAVREVESLYRDAIAAAKECIYIENQYLTSQSITKALADRLSDPDAPEVVIVSPYETDGWLEWTTMDVLRARALRGLRAADRKHRLRTYYPHVPGLAKKESVIVHAKLMVVDDRLLRIGSANLSNRSMGFDTECDLAIEAGDRDDVRQAISGFRNRLIAEHLGKDLSEVAAALEREGSLIAAIDALSPGQRTLLELSGEVPEALESLIPESKVIDPERSLDLEALTEYVIPEEDETQDERAAHLPRSAWIKGLALLGAVLAMAGLWRWTPLADALSPDKITAWAQGFSDEPLAPLFSLAVFLGASLVAFPITALIVVTAVVFGPALGFVCSVAGWSLGAAAGYGIGHGLGRNSVRRLAGERLNKLSRRLGERGVLAVAAIRTVPIAPFTIVNLVAGASHVRFRDYMLGTLLGMTPGTLALTALSDGVMRAIRDPDLGTLAWTVLVVGALGCAVVLMRRWLSKRNRSGEAAGREGAT